MRTLTCEALLEPLSAGNVICVVQCVKSVRMEFSAVVAASPEMTSGGENAMVSD